MIPAPEEAGEVGRMGTFTSKHKESLHRAYWEDAEEFLNHLINRVLEELKDSGQWRLEARVAGRKSEPRTPGVGAIMLGSPMYVTGMNQF